MSDFRSSLVSWLPGFCLFFLAAAATIGMFNGGAWASCGIGGGALLFLAVWIADKKVPLPPLRATLFVLAVLVVFAAELPLSAYGGISARVWLQLATIFVPLLLLTAPRLQRVAYAPFLIPCLAIAAAVGAIGLGIELLNGGVLLHMLRPRAGVTEYNRGVAHMVIFAFPLLAGLWAANRRKEACALALILLFPAGLTESHTAKVALIIGVVCAAVAFFWPVFTRYGLAFLSCLLMGWPFYAQYAFAEMRPMIEKLHASFADRVEIWDYLSYRIAERPFFGWGLGTTHKLDFRRPDGPLYHYATTGAPHAHNFIVELWVETGLAGLGFGLAFLIGCLHAVTRLRPGLQPFALGCWAAAVTVSLFGFDFWTDALWSAFALSAFLFGILQQKGVPQGNRKPGG